MKKFKYKGVDFIVQAYLKNEFANVCIPEGGTYSLDFKKNTFETHFKDTSEEKRLQNERIKDIIEVDKMKVIIDNLFE